MRAWRNAWVVFLFLFFLTTAGDLFAAEKPRVENEKINHTSLTNISRGTVKKTYDERTFEGVLGEVNDKCDATCNGGEPCICPPGCTCREPTCSKAHSMKITWEMVMKEIETISNNITQKLGGNVSASLAGKWSGPLEIHGAEGKGTFDAEVKGRAEGYRKEENLEKDQDTRKLSTGGSFTIGCNDHAKRGFLLKIQAKATLKVTFETIRVDYDIWNINPISPLFSSHDQGTRHETTGLCTVGISLNNTMEEKKCPCTSAQPDTAGNEAGGEKKEEAEKGVFLGGKKKTSFVGIRVPQGSHGGSGGTGFKVQVDGKPVSKDKFKVTPGTTDPTIAVVTIRHKEDPNLGATITVIDPEKKVHKTVRPPNRIQLVNKVNISRGETSTTITVAPEVNTEGPDGDKKTYKGGKSPTGTPPGVFIRKDKKGFWKGLGDFINRTLPGVLIPLTTGYLLNPGRSGGGTVKGGADGVTKIEVPNEVFDEAMDRANKVDPDFGLTDVANTIETGTGLSQGSVALTGFSVINYVVLGGSPFEVRSGSQVAFMVSGVKGAVSQAQVALRGAQGPLGFMQVLSVASAGPGKAVVEAAFSSVPDNADPFWGAVTLNGRTSNEVPFMASPGSVDVVALQKIVTEGGKVTIQLRATGGLKIKGSLALAGPGVFVANNGKRIDVDASGSISYDVHTRLPGLITATFTPKKTFQCTEDMIKLLELAGLTQEDIQLD